MTHSLSLGRLTATLRRPGFWLVVVLLAVITVFQYADRLEQPAFLADLASRLGLDRHAFERIAYLAPIIWSVFLFGLRGAILTSVVAFACMLPRAIAISEQRVDALFETVAVFVVGIAVVISFESLRRQRERYRAALVELEAAHRLLQRYVQSARSNEKRLNTLNAISTMLTGAVGSDEVLRRAIHLVMELMDVEVALIFDLDGQNDELVLAAYEGVSDEFAQAVGRVRIGESANGRVAQTGQALAVGDASLDPMLASPEARSMKIKNELIVPLLVKGNVTGTLCVGMRRPREFLSEEVDLLAAVGSQIGAAIDHARLYEKQHPVAETSVVAAVDFQTLFDSAGDAIWVHDLEGNILAANRATQKLTGYALDELAGMKVTDFLSDEGRNAAEVRRRLFEDQPLEQHYEQRLVRKDGSEAVVELTTSLVVEDGRPVGFQDIARELAGPKDR